MDWSATVLSTVSSDTEPTVVITFDSAKYVFNVGENTNRSFLQSRRNWKKTKGLFFTSVGTERASGLAGLLMTLADATIPKLDIVGPPGTSHFVAAMRSYTYRDTMPVNIIESSPSISTNHLYKDNNITVYGLPIIPSSTSTEPSVLKRKSDVSPEGPTKRPRVDPSPSEAPTNLVEVTDSSSSSSGPDNNSHLRLLINTMFPGSQKPPVQEAKGKKKKSKNQCSELEPSTSAQPPVANSIDVYKRSRLPRGFHQQLPRFSYESAYPSEPSLVGRIAPPTLAYIIVGPRIRGKFDVKRAEALGVPFGRLRGELTKGHSVTFEVKVGDVTESRTVRPEECVGQSESPGALIILDVPSPAYIPSLVSSFTNSPTYAKFRSQRDEDLEDYNVRTVFHLCGKGVLEDERYREFMQGFAPDVHHMAAAKDYLPDPVTFTSAAFNQLRLHQLDPSVFPLPGFSLVPTKDLSTLPNLPQNMAPLKSNTLIKMRPFAPPTVDPIYSSQDLPVHDRFHPAVDAESSTQVPLSIPPSTMEQFKAARAQVDSSAKTLVPGRGTQQAKDVKVTPLGTGSALPTKYRNVSSTLIQIPKWGSILLDAGEGTWGQLVRLFGAPNTEHEDAGRDFADVNAFLRDLRCMYVSHIHGDHHMGVAKILAKRRQLDPPPNQPLYLVAVRAVHVYLREISDLEDLGIYDTSSSGVVTVLSESLHWKRPNSYQTSGMWQLGGDEPWTDIQASQSAAEELCQALGLESFKTVDVYHRTRCYGAIIKHRDGWSIVFSGDTQPTQNLVWAGKGATLLIHEATMADDQEEMARKKAHSTFGQAVDIGRRMGAENILLTHFSARYPKLPPDAKLSPSEGNDAKGPIIALAFDHATIKLGDMWKLSHYMRAIGQCLADSVDEGDEEDNAVDSIEVDVS